MDYPPATLRIVRVSTVQFFHRSLPLWNKTIPWQVAKGADKIVPLATEVQDEHDERHGFMLSFALIIAVATCQLPEPEKVDQFWSEMVPGDFSILEVGRAKNDLKVDDAQVKRILDRIVELKAKLVTDQVGARGLDLKPEERKADGARKRRETYSLIDAVILKELTKEQYIRYKQISVQSHGVMAFARPEIHAILKTTPEQKDQIDNIVKDVQLFVRRSEAALTPADRSDKTKVHDFVYQMDRLKADSVPRCLAILDDSQKATWLRITGTPLALVSP